MSRLTVLAALLSSFTALACSSSTTHTEADASVDVVQAPRCIPGAAAACACPNGLMGAQTCNATGAFEPCNCERAAPCVRGMSVACACSDGRSGAQSCLGDEGFGPCACVGLDAGSPIDVPLPDVPLPDVPLPDVGTPDVGAPDVGTPDVGSPDVGSPDVATPDACVRITCPSVRAGCGRHNDGCGAVLDCGPCRVPSVQNVRLSANFLVADRARNVIYASVSATVPMYGNRVVVIDPTSATVVGSVFVGSEPGSMAMSDDGQALYVSLVGANAIRRIDLATRTATEQFPTGTTRFGDQTHARDMVVMPGTRDVVAASLHRASVSPSFGGVAVYERGVRRSMVTADHTGASLLVRGDATRLYGFNNLHTGFGFYEIGVDAAGARTTREARGLVAGFSTRLVAGDGLVYATSGEVVDTATMTVFGRYPASGLVVPDRPRGRTYFLRTPSSGALVLDAYDHDMFVLLDSAPVSGAAGTPVQAVRYAPGGLALLTSSGSASTGTIYLIQSDLITSE